MDDKKCPVCNLINPESATRCDCGYDFAKGAVVERADGRGGDSPSAKNSNAGGLSWGFIAALAAGFFLASHRNELGDKGGFIIIIGAIAVGIFSANLLGRK